jgi:hypothetical protein
MWLLSVLALLTEIRTPLAGAGGGGARMMHARQPES